MRSKIWAFSLLPLLLFCVSCGNDDEQAVTGDPVTTPMAMSEEPDTFMEMPQCGTVGSDEAVNEGVSAPDVVGMSVDDAWDAFSEAGLTACYVLRPNETVPAGTVVLQGNGDERGDVVMVVVSTGPDPDVAITIDDDASDPADPADPSMDMGAADTTEDVIMDDPPDDMNGAETVDYGDAAHAVEHLFFEMGLGTHDGMSSGGGGVLPLDSVTASEEEIACVTGYLLDDRASSETMKLVDGLNFYATVYPTLPPDADFDHPLTLEERTDMTQAITDCLSPTLDTLMTAQATDDTSNVELEFMQCIVNSPDYKEKLIAPVIQLEIFGDGTEDGEDVRILQHLLEHCRDEWVNSFVEQIMAAPEYEELTDEQIRCMGPGWFDVSVGSYIDENENEDVSVDLLVEMLEILEDCGVPAEVLGL